MLVMTSGADPGIHSRGGWATGVSQEPPRGVWGHAPPGKFGKMDALRLNLVKFWSKKCTKSHSDSKK